eukprot:CAMPEP_0113827740 /NCGR_PEP_ID=MMETSP0328-20130328/4918_1 /TAXON_ID=39455 /ORGANISM="Alexandrium minutum" /LENGTH=86 /DNA_ID=CAMNT_0000795729 /DNA_START=12 /DNA_END=268 /DNA_ORIENTATION=- /assembly_acc=CAM_ASM_000350
MSHRGCHGAMAAVSLAAKSGKNVRFDRPEEGETRNTSENIGHAYDKCTGLRPSQAELRKRGLAGQDLRGQDAHGGEHREAAVVQLA